MNLPYMQFYPADYFAKTRRLTCLEHGAYLQLLFMMWESNGVLKYDVARLSDEIGLTVEEFEQVWARVGRFFQIKKGRVYNKRISEDLANKKGISEKRKKASETRWSKINSENNVLRDASALQSDPIPEPEPEPEVIEDVDDKARELEIVTPILPDTDWPEPAQTAEHLALTAGISSAQWQILTVSELLAWRANGFSYALDVVPTVTEAFRRKRDGPPRSWAYFTPAIAQHRANRLKSIDIPEAQNERRNTPYQTAAERNQDSTVRAFQRVFGATADEPDEPFDHDGATG